MTLLLPFNQGLATLGNVAPGWVEHTVIVHCWQCRAVTIEGCIRSSPLHDALVVVEAVLVPRFETPNTCTASRHICVDVVVMDVVMAFEVAL